MRSKSLGSRDGKHREDSKVGPDVMGKSESKEREGNSGLRSGKYVCVVRWGGEGEVDSDIKVMEGNVKRERERERGGR